MSMGFDPEKITFFARTNARGQNMPFGMKAKDRQRHMYVIGKTGMGKSTLLENMAAQDIANGEGMAFLDPHGSAIEALLEYVPEERLDDVVYFAPFDMDNPISFNIMEDVGIDSRHLVVSGLMSTFKKIWEDAWSARMEYILTNALLALIEYPDTTLLSVNRMLADKAYRDKVIDYVKDPAVKAYWVDEFNNYTERFAAEALPAIQNKIGQFTGNPLIRNIIGQPKSSFDIRKMMDEKKILLVNLSKGLVGETNADLLGSMLTTKIYLAAMSRAELPPAQMKQMPNFYFYVDEFQSFSNSTFANILSEARKYHLNLIIAHQYVEQMEEKVRDAVFGNVGTTVTFRVGPFDAETLEPIFEPQFVANDLVNLGFAQIYLTLMIDGVGSVPFSAQTLPPLATPEKSHKHMVIKRSQQNYCCSREEAEKMVNSLHTPDERVEASEKGEGANHGGFTKPSAFFKVGKDKEFVKQKERLKDGGSRLKGPAQTAPGTKSTKPADTQSKPKTNERRDSARSDRPAPRLDKSAPARDTKQQPKPVQKPEQKSPEDLKAIIAKMANAPDKTSSDKKSNKQSANTNDTRTKPAEQANEKPELGGSKHRSDLKAALAGVLPVDAPPATAEKKQQTQSPQHNNKTKKPAKQFDSHATKRPETQPDRNVAKQTVEQPAKKTHIANEIIKDQRPNNQQKNKDVLLETFAARPASAPEPTPPQPKQSTQPAESPIKKVVVERRPQVHIPVGRTTVEPAPQTAPTSLPPTVGSHRSAPAFTPHSITNAPDVGVVKRMLRTGGNDQLPGMD